MADWPDLAHTYDAVARDYAEKFAGELAGKPFDRGLLDAFAERVRGPVLDVGCGPAGHIARYLADRGVTVAGVDLSPASVRLPELAGLLEDASFTILEQHRREPHPNEYPTPRLYLRARR